MPDQSPDEISAEIQQLLQQAILNNYPNPERQGCPGPAMLREVARRQVPIRDAHWEHVTHCSPCFQEFIELRTDFAAARKRLVQRNRIVLATVLVLAGIVGALVWRSSSRPGAPIITAEATSDVDMRPFSTTRGESNKNPQPSEQYAGILSRKRSRLNVILPVGAQEGTYEVRVMDNDLNTIIASGKAPATFVDHTVRLTITFDLTEVSPGPYVIASRRDGGGWMTSPVLIR
jgi:hypothetical protein